MNDNTLTPEAIASLHLESYGCHPDDCSLCQAGDPTYAIEVYLGENAEVKGVVLRHQSQLRLVPKEEKNEQKLANSNDKNE